MIILIIISACLMIKIKLLNIEKCDITLEARANKFYIIYFTFIEYLYQHRKKLLLGHELKPLQNTNLLLYFYYFVYELPFKSQSKST